MKILLIGLGSAGQRHMRNLKRILGEEAEFIAYRVRKYSRMFDDNMNIVENEDVNTAYGIRVFDRLEDAILEKPEIAVIANPNSMHVKCALQAAEAGIDIFLEKPISDSMEGITQLQDIIKKRKLILYVGYQMRFHPCIVRLKEELEKESIGRIIHVDCQIGELISGMHKYEDYRQMNEAKKETGGGVVLCQIHELDYLYWIFGMPKEVFSIGNKLSELELEVEDTVTTICRYEKDGMEYPVVIHQDFLQHPPVRKCQVTGTRGRIEIDLLNNKYKMYKDNDAEEITYDGFVRNDMFVEEIKLFLQNVKTRKQQMLTLEDGLGSLKIALAIKESMYKKESIKIEEEQGIK